MMLLWLCWELFFADRSFSFDLRFETSQAVLEYFLSRPFEIHKTRSFGAFIDDLGVLPLT